MARHAKHRILVVDDDDAMREALQDALCEMGVEVEAAADGLLALARLRSGPRPCVVLLDMRMPHLDGAGLVGALRGDPALRDLPVVCMTGDSREAPLDVSAWLHKPFDLAELGRLLASLCG